MTPTELRTLGAQLGDDWQDQLAVALPCDPSTIRSWLCGRRRIRPMIAARIREVIKALLRKKS